ncbi:hypothetical protein FE296_22495 [Paenibacillus sp. UASWS1643]|nr:hypothetical protein FE296_22495 [Paenibacillus sp. UASWS1643]
MTQAYNKKFMDVLTDEKIFPNGEYRLKEIKLKVKENVSLNEEDEENVRTPERSKVMKWINTIMAILINGKIGNRRIERIGKELYEIKDSKEKF